MTVAISDLDVIQPIVANIHEVAATLGWKVITASEPECSRMLLHHTVELALISPLGYAKGVGKVDYRIVPQWCVALENFTNVAGISFANTAPVAQPTPDFIQTISELLIREKFDGAEDLHVNAFPIGKGAKPTLDLGEEWFDFTETPLPLALWVARTEADIEHLMEGVASMASTDITDVPVSEMVSPGAEHEPREGTVMYKWNSSVSQGLDEVLHILFYHQLVPELPAIKIFGSDD